MALESATTIAGLNASNPVGASDTPAQLDDHIRLIKTVLKADALVNADIGVTVQAYDATTLKDADIGVSVQAYDATILKDADIGVSVQAYDATALNEAGALSLLNASGSAPVYACRAWVNFNGTGTTGTNQTIRASGNVTSVYKNGTGDYTINFTTALQDANYVIVGCSSPGDVSDGNTGTVAPRRVASPYSTSSIRISTQLNSDVSGASADMGYVNVAVFR